MNTKKLNIEEIKQILKENICYVTFTKKDGTKRDMKCTLNSERIPTEKQPKNTEKVKKQSKDVIPVFDLDKNEWRSFNIDSVTDFFYQSRSETI